MPLTAITDGKTPSKRYRLPGIDREGIAQLSLLETALWPLHGGRLPTPRFETAYTFQTSRGKQTARVTVRSATGLEPIDEYILWGILGSTLSHPNADSVLLATPYWILKQLGMKTGGSQYATLRESLLRLTATSYQNTGFYNPETHEHEYVAFQFLSMLLPTVGGTGEAVDNDRCWRIEWNPAFFRFCRATGGNLLFDLDLYRELTPAARRLFLKLKDRFWRSPRVFLNVDDLTINGLGFSASRPLFKRKFDLIACIRELLDRQVIELGRGQTDPHDLFLKHGKGVYVVTFYAGEYFRCPLSERTTRQQKAIADDPLYQPLRKIGVDEAAIRRLFHDFPRGQIKSWISVTDAAMHEKPQGFDGFKVSPAAFLIDGIQNQRMPPDWMFAHEKRQQKVQWERERAVLAEEEQRLHAVYEQSRSAALAAYLASDAGRQKYEQTYQPLLTFYKVTEPDRYHAAAREAALARIDRLDFQFPEYSLWALTQQQETSGTGI